MRNRIDKLGVAEPEIRKQGTDQIVIQLAGRARPGKAAELIGKTAQLQLFDLEADLDRPVDQRRRLPDADASLYALLAGQQAQAKQGHAECVLPLQHEEDGSSSGPSDDEGGDCSSDYQRAAKTTQAAAEGTRRSSPSRPATVDPSHAA